MGFPAAANLPANRMQRGNAGHFFGGGAVRPGELGGIAVAETPGGMAGGGGFKLSRVRPDGASALWAPVCPHGDGGHGHSPALATPPDRASDLADGGGDDGVDW